MKKQMTWMLAAMLTCSVALGACGGGAAPQEQTAQEDAVVAEEEAANPDEQVEQDNPAEKFVGSWKFAYLQDDGVTMVGDLETLEELFGTSVGLTITFDEGGTGTYSLADETIDSTWEVDSAGNAVVRQTDDGYAETMTYTYEDGELRSTLEDMSVMTFTHDGTSEKVKPVAINDAVDFTSADELVGNWKLSGVVFVGSSMEGVSITGETDKVLEYASEGFADASFSDDGTCTFIGKDVPYTVGENGSTIDAKGGSIPIKRLDDCLVVDLVDRGYALLYSKA